MGNPETNKSPQQQPDTAPEQREAPKPLDPARKAESLLSATEKTVRGLQLTPEQQGTAPPDVQHTREAFKSRSKQEKGEGKQISNEEMKDRLWKIVRESDDPKARDRALQTIVKIEKNADVKEETEESLAEGETLPVSMEKKEPLTAEEQTLEKMKKDPKYQWAFGDRFAVEKERKAQMVIYKDKPSRLHAQNVIDEYTKEISILEKIEEHNKAIDRGEKKGQEKIPEINRLIEGKQKNLLARLNEQRSEWFETRDSFPEYATPEPSFAEKYIRPVDKYFGEPIQKLHDLGGSAAKWMGFHKKTDGSLGYRGPVGQKAHETSNATTNWLRNNQ